MKNFSLLFICIIISNFVWGQDPSLLNDGKLSIDSFYSDKTELLISSSIIVIDSVNKSELIKGVKNWAGLKFVNLKEVLVSETDDQLVFNYVTNSYSTNISWYIKFVCQFKDGKFKTSYYDDGNVVSPVVASRKYHFKDFFKDQNGNIIAENRYKSGLLSLHENILLTTASLKSYFLKMKSNKNEW